MNKTLQLDSMKQNLMLQIFTAKQYSWFRHLVLIVFSVAALYYTDPEYREPFETYSRTLLFFQVIGLSYVNMYYLVPKFLFRNHYLAYCISAIGVIAVVAVTHDIFAYAFEPKLLPYQNDHINIISFSFVTLVLIIASAAVKLFQQWVLDA